MSDHDHDPSRNFTMRLRESEHELVRQAAEYRGFISTPWVRSVVLLAARAALKEKNNAG